MLELQEISGGYGDGFQVKDISLQWNKGEIIAIIGPNGSGKTTFLRMLARLSPMAKGQLYWEGQDVTSYPQREYAKLLSFLPQQRDTPNILARALVAHGRFPYLGFSRVMTPKDQEQIDRAVALTGIEGLLHRPVNQLSGGERQKVYLAMLIAQDTPVVLLDEPTTYLDLHHRFEVMEIIRTLRKAGKVVVLVMHELAEALGFADQICLLEKGDLICQGSPNEVLESGAIDRVFGVRTCKFVQDGEEIIYFREVES